MSEQSVYCAEMVKLLKGYFRNFCCLL